MDDFIKKNSSRKFNSYPTNQKIISRIFSIKGFVIQHNVMEIADQAKWRQHCCSLEWKLMYRQAFDKKCFKFLRFLKDFVYGFLITFKWSFTLGNLHQDHFRKLKICLPNGRDLLKLIVEKLRNWNFKHLCSVSLFPAKKLLKRNETSEIN